MTSLLALSGQRDSDPTITVWLYRIATSLSNFTRTLGGVGVLQPVIQYGTATSTGTAGSVTVNLPASYSSVGSYIALGVMQDATAARVSVEKNSQSQITIYWSQGGPGVQALAWSTMGN